MLKFQNTTNKTLEENKDKLEKGNKLCNCRNKTNCPLGGKCLIKSVVYKATVKQRLNHVIYRKSINIFKYFQK